VKGTIFDIKRYAIHDGPGIRTTVFFKGCTLRCRWCHNPEGIEREREIMFRSERCAVECQDCVSVCPQRAITKKRKVISIDRMRCDLCAKCEEACAYEAVELVGREVSAQEILNEIEKDRIFYDESKGGVTLSGGEPLVQPDFLLDLLTELNKRNIHTAVDTSGFVPSEILRAVSQKADLLLYDLKVMDEEKHKKYTGESNTLILENLRKLSGNGKKIIIRMPVLAGLNDDDENIQKQADFLKSCGGVEEIDLLLYHRGGEEKRKRLRKKDPLEDFRAPSDRRLQEIKDRLSCYGFSVKIGG
jgi:pyruvate formate lyase activating enzyme